MIASSLVGNSDEAVRCYLHATKIVAKILATMFEAIFPVEYKKHRTAFDAGVWIQEDPGPWLGRAIVYKLDTELHYDQEDGGPTAIFPVGQYSGGTLDVPQLRARLE